MRRSVSRAVLIVAAFGLAAPSFLTLEGCGIDLGQLLKGGGEKGAAAKTSGQKSGSTATSNKSKATDLGPEYEQVTCEDTDTDEGFGWCDSDTHLVFCSEGHMWEIDCAEIDDDVCGEDGEKNLVDCFAAAEFE
jgi:hypothetical protein